MRYLFIRVPIFTVLQIFIRYTILVIVIPVVHGEDSLERDFHFGEYLFCCLCSFAIFFLLKRQ